MTSRDRAALQIAAVVGAVLGGTMMTVRQACHLIDWVIAGLIVIGGLLYFFGPASLRTDEVIVIGLIILGLIGFQIGLRRSQ